MLHGTEICIEILKQCAVNHNSDNRDCTGVVLGCKQHRHCTVSVWQSSAWRQSCGLMLCLTMREREGNLYCDQHGGGACEPNVAVCFSVSAVDGVSINAVLAML
jgi:hypothetical protein